ncbi:MAG: hypothetical protein KDA99_05815 [Planctomycetales bacterium]|nr:hypothetical protein [Planctomycetales bacterium]
MMTSETILLAATAVSIGFFHTLLGPDHYVPFVAMSRAGKWPLGKTLLVTMSCGVGHVASSVLIGLIGLWLGTMAMRLQVIEAWRGNVAAWLLVGFGAAYMVWGIMRALRSVPHSHVHAHADGTVHYHQHVHDTEHVHVHAAGNRDKGNSRAVVTPWLLFLIFIFGPCEPLIPLLIYPAAEANATAVLLVVLTFAITTLITMSGMVLLLSVGLKTIRWRGLERYGHAIAGLAAMTCGLLIMAGL